MNDDKFYKLYRHIQLLLVIQAINMLVISIAIIIR